MWPRLRLWNVMHIGACVIMLRMTCMWVDVELLYALRSKAQSMKSLLLRDKERYYC